MWHRTGGVITACVAVGVLQVAQGRAFEPADCLVAQAGWVRLDLAMGRLKVTGTRAGQNQNHLAAVHASGEAESLTVAIDRGHVSMRYSYTSPTETLTISVSSPYDVEISRSGWLEDNCLQRMHFKQAAHGNLSLAVRHNERVLQECSCPSLWHLLIAEPDLCSEHLFPMLIALRPDWQILDDVTDIRHTLFSEAKRPATVSRAEVRSLVAQLGAEDFRRRRNAARHLRELGPTAWSYLDEFTAHELDREQCCRLQSLRQEIQSQSLDSPSRVAKWLGNDRHVWLTLMADEDPARRAIAGQQLARVCDRAIDFDPTAPAAQRADQIASLRGELLR